MVMASESGDGEDGGSFIAIGSLTGEDGADWLAIFEGLGVDLPPGASIAYHERLGLFQVKTTPEGQARMAKVLADLDLTPGQLRIGLELVAYRLGDIDDLSRGEGAGRIDSESLGELRSEGKGRVICALQAVTLSGSETTVKSVREYIYPTEFTVSLRGGATNGDMTVSGCTVEPKSFETREAGCVFTVLPELNPDTGEVCLTIAPEWVSPDVTWREYGSSFVDAGGVTRHLPMKQPFFDTSSLTTCFNLLAGAEVLAGGGLPSRDRKEIAYWLISADHVDLWGQRLKTEDSDAVRAGQVRIVEEGEMCRCEIGLAPYAYMDFPPLGGQRSNESEEQYIERLLTGFGVEWPDGSELRWTENQGRLVIRNTRTNIDIALRILRLLTPHTQLEIELQFLAFDKADIEAMRRQKGRVEQTDLLTLRRSGRGSLLSAPKTATVSGSETTVKGVREYIYPTQFADKPVPQIPGQQRSECHVMGQAAFETREVGTIFTVLPEVNPYTGVISLTLAPDVVWEPEWTDYGEGVRKIDGKKAHAPCEQPFFNTWSLMTTVNTESGALVLIGRAPHPKDETKEVFLFCRATLLDFAGNVIE